VSYRDERAAWGTSGRTPWGRLFRRDHVLVMGLPGCGKTPFALALAADAARVVFFDMAGEAPEGWRVIDAADLCPADLRGAFLRVAVRPDPEDPAGSFLRVVACCRAVALEGGLVLVVDECGDLTENAAAARALRGLHRNGHKDGVATVLASPVWTDFPKRCRDTASRVYSFAQRTAADVRLLNEELGRHVPGFGDLAAAWKYPAPPVAWVSPTLHA
jgi:hypothetical protein